MQMPVSAIVCWFFSVNVAEINILHFIKKCFENMNHTLKKC